jgi:diguanylate cyclase (GGDEF)-like protein
MRRSDLNRSPERADMSAMTLMPLSTAPVSLDSLPSMPAAAVRIVGLCDDPDVELSGLADAVALDPALSARILRIANSAAYSRGNEVTSLDRAMMLMGIKLVKLTALGFVVSSTLSDEMDSGDDIASQVWRQCLVKAVACRELAQMAGMRATPEAFLAGLFDGMGQLLGVVTRAESYGPLLADEPFPGAEAERGALGMTTSELVQAALRSWGVPELYARVLEDSDAEQPSFDDSEIGRLAAVVVLARQATRLLLGHPSDAGAAEEARAALGLDDDAVDRIAVDLGGHVNDLAATLGVDLGAQVDFPALLTHARDQMIQTSMMIAEESMMQTSRINDLEGQREELRRDAMTDRLTGLPNRASFDDTLAAAVEDRLSGRTVSGALGVAMIDIDHFKKFNDTYGHRAGDRVLEAVGEALASCTRKGETIARYGGEEFVLVMPILESANDLAAAAERIRCEIGGLKIDSEGLVLTVTASVGGVASSAIVGPEAAAALVEAADRLLYQAKNAGRNTTRTDFRGASSIPR